MKMVNKYIVHEFRQTYTIPKGSDFLSISLDPQGNISLYFAVDPEVKETDTRTFWIVHTGRSIPDDSDFIGTFEKEDLMFHAFELLNRHSRKTIVRNKNR
jgi:hypothetical protein